MIPSLLRSQIWMIPGLVMVGLVLGVRSVGSLQGLELVALDTFLRLRPAEAIDERILVVAIDAEDIRQMGGDTPIPKPVLKQLLQKIQAHQPAVIGLNLFKNLWDGSDAGTVSADLRSYRNLVVVEKVLDEQIPAIAGIPKSQVGFSDIYLDQDSHLRRMLLGTPNPLRPNDPQDYRFSFAIRLTELYLRREGLSLGNGVRDSAAMRFGHTELPRFQPNSGSYVNEDDGGLQILLNFRSGSSPFRVISWRDLQSDRFEPEWIRDRIVIIGITDPTLRTPIKTSAIDSKGEIPGLMIQTHAVSQLVSAVIDRRPLIESWPDSWEWVWIVGWGAIGIYIGGPVRVSKAKFVEVGARKRSLEAGLSSLILVGVSYAALSMGLWIPLIPALLVINLNAIALWIYSSAFYKNEKLSSRIQQSQQAIEVISSRSKERQQTIEETFHVIHNGPLQSLATLLRLVRDGKQINREELIRKLEMLDLEIRSIGEHLQQQPSNSDNQLYLSTDLILDLSLPIHELFYEVYLSTLTRPFPAFQTLKVKSSSFEPIEDQKLSFSLKAELCRFLEEALCNVGKHAEGCTHLTATNQCQSGICVLQIIDNGRGTYQPREGEGTKRARHLSSRLNGQFRREARSPRGVICELVWKISSV